MGVKYQSSDGRTETTFAPIGVIPFVHGLYMFNPNACLTFEDVKGGGYDDNGRFIGPDKCVLCGPLPPPPPPPPDIPSAEIYTISICFALRTAISYDPQGCWTWNQYVNYDGPPPLNYVYQRYPLIIPTVYEGYTLIVDTSYGYILNDVSHHVGENIVDSGSVYTGDPNNPSAPATFNYDATQAAATNVVNGELAAAHAALGI